MIDIRIPAPLRPYADGQKEIGVSGETIAEALEDLARRYPAMQPHLFDEGGALRPYVNLFLNGQEVGPFNGGTRLHSGDRLVIVPSIAGGWGPPGAGVESRRR